MIGSALKKLAVENGMKVSNGVAYGSLRGYAATLSEGAGYKQIAFSVSFTDPAQKALFMDAVNDVDVEKLYRVQHLSIASRNIQVVFFDNPGTMKKVQEFLDWFIPLLDQYSATKADVCAECGAQISSGCWKLVDGIAHHMHESCGEKVRAQISEENATRKEKSEGSYGQGLIGALVGAAIGAIVWAFVLHMGYVASLVGLLIGFLAEKGYNLLGGKQGKGKVVILIVAVVSGVLIGTFGADVITIVSMISNGETFLTYADIPSTLLLLLKEDPQYRSAVISNILMGLLFAGIGVFALLRKTGKAVADAKFIDLN